MTNKDVIYKDVILKMQLMAPQKMSEVVTRKTDMIILEKSEFSALRSENEVKLKSHSYLSSAFLLGYGGIMHVHKSVQRSVHLR